MNAASIKRRAIEVSIAAAIVFCAAFVPWGKVDFGRVAAPLRNSGELGEGINQIVRSFGIVPITIWNGHASISGIKLPNVLVLFAALAATLAMWSTAISVYNVPAAVTIGIACYGLAHSGFVFAKLLVSQEGSVGIGVVVTVLAFSWMLAVVLRSTMKWGGTSRQIQAELDG